MVRLRRRSFFFRVRLDVSELGMDESGMTSAVRLIFDYKNVRSWLECLETFTRRPLPIAVATAGVMRTLNRVRLWSAEACAARPRSCGDGRHHAYPEPRAPAFPAGAGGPRAPAHRRHEPDPLARLSPSLHAARPVPVGRGRIALALLTMTRSRVCPHRKSRRSRRHGRPAAVGGVATENPEYFCLLTAPGAALEAAAHAAGRPVRLTVISVGDGDGEVPVPADAAVDLVREVYRRPIDSLSQDEEDPNICWAHIVIPTTEGGFWIREFGVWGRAAGRGRRAVLYAYGNHAPFYKLKSVLGQATTHELSVPIIMSGTADVEIVISEAGYASRLELLQLSGIVEDLRRNREAVWTLDAPWRKAARWPWPEGLTYAPGNICWMSFGRAWPAIRGSSLKNFLRRRKWSRAPSACFSPRRRERDARAGAPLQPPAEAAGTTRPGGCGGTPHGAGTAHGRGGIHRPHNWRRTSWLNPRKCN